ncbi:GGDEF domain-containing protein [Sphingomonas sp. VNH70]|uniref:GGDEF domain-containing protein n=1 Tax=Sphingomonas silueang TaxID=3156617 RepID=UPI0032B49F0D
MARWEGTAPLGAVDGLFHAIGHFLADQRLEPTPVNYAFAYHVLSDPAGPLAQAVAERTDGGFRLTSAEIATLGERIEGGRLPERRGPVSAAWAAETQRQMAGFESMMHAIRDETHAFGRDLAASEDALRRPGLQQAGTDTVIAELARITAAMRQRVDVAESQLAQATLEAGELRRQLATAQGDARRDALTGLPNRRAFEEAMATRPVDPCHIALCDVDHFKSINDRYGHPVGDRVLKAIGATLARACEGHLVSRHGGEEFCVLMTGISAADARLLLEDARLAVAERRYRLREDDRLIEGVTLSAGIVTLREGESTAEAIARADRFLYCAKEAGRNRTLGEMHQ